MKFSKIQLGTVQFGLNYGIANTAGKPSYENARDIIAAAYEGGINTLDTAAAYGDSEEILGRALTELKLQGKVQVISKVPPVSAQNFSSADAEAFITESVENSLRRLRLDYLNVCLFHREDDLMYLDVLRQLESRGLIKGCGVSLDSTKYCADTLEQDVKYIQLPYNIFDKRFDKFLSQASAGNIKIFTRSLYLQGLLLMPENQIKPFLSEVIPVRRQLEQLAESADMSMPELCVRYVLSNPAITSILTGVDNLSQLEENIKLMAKGPLLDNLYLQTKKMIPNFPEEIIRPVCWVKNM
jgi:aryl-alcohol dehydrogenase-like predicted oxidoreductase